MRTFVVDPKLKVLRDVLPNYAKPPTLFKTLSDVSIEAGGINGTNVASTRIHPFIQAAHNSFAEHRPLALRPDSFWLCIAQGLSAHINLFPEDVRTIFVAHQGQETIEVRRDGFVKGSPNNDWPGAFAEFDTEIAKRLKGESHQRLKAQFSTTTPIDSAAYSIVLMESMKAYFKYRMSTLCCIPEITLLGETDDWKRLHVQTQQLQQWWNEQIDALPDPKKVSLDWWFEPLMRVLDMVVETADGGMIDTKFWGSLYKEGGGSGGPYVTGWINTLFPYLTKGGIPTRPNTLMGRWGTDGYRMSGGPSTDSFPNGISVVPFIWKYYAEEFRMQFLGGFAGVAQDMDTFAISATTGWAVSEAPSSGAPAEVSADEI
jgi:hypothetical protein